MTLKFTVPGKPTGKGRPRASVIARHVHMRTPEKTVLYENWVRSCYIEAYGLLQLVGPLAMDITAVFAVPTSYSKSKRKACLTGEIAPTCKPDVDNLAKAVADALNGVAYRDDSSITELRIRKQYGPCAQLVVTLREVQPWP